MVAMLKTLPNDRAVPSLDRLPPGTTFVVEGRAGNFRRYLVYPDGTKLMLDGRSLSPAVAPARRTRAQARRKR